MTFIEFAQKNPAWQIHELLHQFSLRAAREGDVNKAEAFAAVADRVMFGPAVERCALDYARQVISNEGRTKGANI